jgi:uncharacterized protein YjbI with pentapeptide repeats
MDGRRGAAIAGVLLLALCANPAPALAAAQATVAPTCAPGSGRKLAGKQITDAKARARGGLQCADLSGANLSGLDLIQADLSAVLAPNANFSGAKLGQATLSGAVLRGANFQDADLSQATLTGADFSGANLTRAHLEQVEAAGVNLSQTDLSNAVLIQATLNQANLSGAKVDGADFTQAETSGADVDGLRGLTDWSKYLLLGAAVIFLLAAVGPVVRAMRRAPKRRDDPPVAPIPPAPTVSPTTPGSVWQQAQAQSASNVLSQSGASGPSYGMVVPGAGNPGFSSMSGLAGLGGFNPINGPATRGMLRGLVLGLLGALLVAVGAHLFVGGILGQVLSPFDSLTVTACSGPQCAVGINAGTAGAVIGVFAVIFGFGVRAAA